MLSSFVVLSREELGAKKQDQQYDMLQSSSELGWSNLFAELRSYGRGEGAHPAALETTITILLNGSEGTSGWRIGGSWQSSKLIPGLLWVKPIGGEYDEAYTITAETVRVLNLRLATSVFTQLGDNYGLPAALDRSVRYVCGAQDEVVNQIGLSVLSEMMNPTAAGRMFVETASLLLAARLLHAHWDAGSVRLPIERRHRLDDRRLRRVLDYVEEHLAHDITVADLANVACLSIFHFMRSFSVAVGMPPHRYVSQRRLERAKAMIVMESRAIAETAFMCRFFSQSSSTRTFRRATGTMRFGPFELSNSKRVLRRNGVRLPLGSRAFDILVYLAERPGEIISKKELIDHVWSDVTVEEGSLRVHVAAIRKALGDGQFGDRFIVNVKGQGYLFIGSVVRVDDS